jgi:hypothetical protein
MKHSLIAAATLAALCAPVWAINKCTGADGRVTYQEATCEGAKKINLSGAGQADTGSQGSNYWRREIGRLSQKDKVEGAISDEKVFIGMAAADVRRSWGAPHKINTSTGSYGRHEQWIYRRANQQTQYIYVDNGVVTSTQSPE